MARLRIVLVTLVAAALLAMTGGSTGVAQERRDEPAPFDGQFVSIVKKSNPSSSVDLEKVQVRTLGGKSFLVGVGADTSDNWQKGKAVWVAVDDVSEITAFSTLEELRRAGAPPEAKKDPGQ